MARRRVLVLLAVMLLVGAGAALRPSRRAIETMELLDDLGASAASAAVDPGEVASLRQSVVFAAADRRYAADLYLAGATPRAALLLVPGLAPDGKDDRRLVDLAVILARARFAVLVPDIASLRAQRVSADNIRQIADALGYLIQAEGQVASAGGARRPVGIAAISYAVGPALLATLDPALQGQVDFLVGIGGYYDVDAVITYFTTGFYRERPDQAWVPGTPNDYGKWLFVGANSDAVMDMRDRVTLTAIAARRRADPAADVGDLVPLLGPQGHAVYALLANHDPDRAIDLIAALPEHLRDSLVALDLKKRNLSGAPRDVILVHGRDDRIIPAGESSNLAAALPAGRGHLYLVDHLAHADLEPGDWRDVLMLWLAAYRLLELRDGAP
jgi:hypothetical protein